MFSIFGYVQQRIMTKNSIFGPCLPILGETNFFLENPPLSLEQTDGRMDAEAKTNSQNLP